MGAGVIWGLEFAERLVSIVNNGSNKIHNKSLGDLGTAQECVLFNVSTVSNLDHIFKHDFTSLPTRFCILSQIYSFAKYIFEALYQYDKLAQCLSQINNYVDLGFCMIQN